jgi:hypothetical protein
MQSWGRSREVEKPKRTKREVRAIFEMEARGHANDMERLAEAVEAMHGRTNTIAVGLRKGARFIRELTGEPATT